MKTKTWLPHPSSPGDRRYGRRSSREEEPRRGGGGPVVLWRRARGLRVVRFGSRDFVSDGGWIFGAFLEERRERIPTLGQERCRSRSPEFLALFLSAIASRDGLLQTLEFHIVFSSLFLIFVKFD
jgi:hypothetical protein